MNLWTTIKGLLVQDETDRTKEISIEIDPSAATGTRTTLKAAQTVDRTITLPDNDSTLVDEDSVQTLQNKTMDFSSSGNNSLTADAVDVIYDNISSGIAGTNTQDAIDEVEARVEVVEDGLNDHLLDTVDAHDASAISSVPSGALVATDVQSALNELDGDLTAVAQDLTDHLGDAVDAHDASAISNIPSGNLASTDIQSAVDELQSDIDTRALDSDLSNHISNVTDAHDASAISNIPAGNLASTDVQAALDELQSDIDTRATATALSDHINDPSDAHAASAITNTPSGNLASTDVQAALNELQTDIDGISSGTSTASNVGTGAGESFKQKVVNDLQFKTIKAGTGISVTNNADDITIDASVVAANQSLSNLTNPTAVNQDLIFNPTASRTIKMGDETGLNSGKTLNIRGGNVSGLQADLPGGDINLASGTSIGNQGSRLNISLSAAGQASGLSLRSTYQVAAFIANASDAYLALTSPVNASSNVNLEIRTGISNNIIQNGVDNTVGSSRPLNIQGSSNNSTGNTGNVSILTPNKSSGVGNSGQISLATGNVDSGNSGSLSLTTGSSTSGSRGQIAVQASNFYLQQTPLVEATSTFAAYGVVNTVGLPHGGFGIIIIQSTTAITIHGIEAGVQGQHLVIYNENNNNMSFANQSGTETTAANRIITCTGATVVSTGTSCHTLIYLSGRWVLRANQL